MFGLGNNKLHIGFPGPLYILINDHRSSFVKRIMEIEDREAKPEEWAEVVKLKKIVYQGLKLVIDSGLQTSNTTFFIDEQTGTEIMAEAERNGVAYCLAVEKSGELEFDFEYGNDFGIHIEKFNPAFIKALVRYNPEDSEASKTTQKQKLKTLTEYAREHKHKFLLEVRIQPTKAQLAKVNQDQRRFDLEIRPSLSVTTVSELKSAGVDPDVWHLEGFELTAHYENLISKIQEGDRGGVGLVVMSRGAAFPQVESWLSVGARVPGVIGFSAGRTVFQNALRQYRAGEKGQDDAARQIAENFLHFYHIFTQSKEGR